jgi:ATP-dependent DNA helicase DinG
MCKASKQSETKSSQIRDYFPLSDPMHPAQEKAFAAIQRARDTGKKFVSLELPTGTGKSAIAIAAADWAATWGNGAYILSPQKALTRQYMRDFEKDGLAELRGRASYPCVDFQTTCEMGPSRRGKDVTACSSCPYKIAKDDFLSKKKGVTNFDYFIAETLYSGQLPKRSLLVIDEGHNLEQKILGFTDFEIVPFTLQKYSVAIPSIADGDLSSASEWIEDEMIPAVSSFISAFPERDPENLEDLWEAQSLLKRMRRFINDHQDKWMFWKDKKKFVFRPLSVATHSQNLLFSRADMVVIMSATILDQKVFCRTLDIPTHECEFLSVRSDFAVAKRRIIFRPLGSMNYKNKGETLPRIAEALDKLLRARPKRKGLIHTNSYEMNRFLTNALIAAGHRQRVITHGPGGAEAAIERHRNAADFTVLCSPAMTEGIDLHDDLSRFQVIVKVPYPNIQDPYVAQRKTLDRRWYVWQTAVKLIQATGRSVRSAKDFADTYIVDSDFAQFRERNPGLLPDWWLEAVFDVEERKPPASETSIRTEEKRELF